MAVIHLHLGIFWAEKFRVHGVLGHAVLLPALDPAIRIVPHFQHAHLVMWKGEGISRPIICYPGLTITYLSFAVVVRREWEVLNTSLAHLPVVVFVRSANGCVSFAAEATAEGVRRGNRTSKH